MEKIIYFAKVVGDSQAIVPTKENADGGRDIYACFNEENLIIPPFESRLVSTGIASAFSDEHVMILRERGSTGVKNMQIQAGVIDSGYRGEIFVCLYNANTLPVVITKFSDEYIKEYMNEDFITYPYHKAICQALMVKVDNFKEVKIPYKELLKMDSKRGTGKLGSSNK